MATILARSPAAAWSLHRLRGTVLALLLAPLAFADADLRSPASGSSAQAAGTIAGTVEPTGRPPLRTAERYVGTDGSPREVGVVPIVVYVQGEIAGPIRPSGPPRLSQRGETFHPGLLVVPRGTTVAFPNEDPVFHNVFSYSRPKRFDLGRYRRGESKDVRFDRAGYVKVLCEVHKWMRAGVLVVDNPFYAVVAEDGRFRLEQVPAGRHLLVAEAFDRRTEPRAIEVPAGGTVTVEMAF